MYTRGTKSPGQIMVTVLVVMSILMASAMALTRNVLSERRMASLYLGQEMSFYLAEAGIEEMKVTLQGSPNWFTDNPYHIDDDDDWIIYESTGVIKSLGKGKFKMVRESGKNILYSVGFIGKDIDHASARSVIRVKYDPLPFKVHDLKVL